MRWCFSIYVINLKWYFFSLYYTLVFLLADCDTMGRENGRFLNILYFFKLSCSYIYNFFFVRGGIFKKWKCAEISWDGKIYCWLMNGLMGKFFLNETHFPIHYKKPLVKKKTFNRKIVYKKKYMEQLFSREIHYLLFFL